MRPYGDRSRLWFNLRGVWCAYQPYGAPGFAASLHNVMHDRQAVGIHDAGIGGAPDWDRANGWHFNGVSTEYITTSFVAQQDGSQSMIAQIANCDILAQRVVCGARTASISDRFYLWSCSASTERTYGQGGYDSGGAAVIDGNLCVAGNLGYYNGVLDSDPISGHTQPPVYPVIVGAENRSGARYAPLEGDVLAFAIYSRVLSAAEVRLAAYQMAHLHNPEYSAWSNVRRWWPAYTTAEEAAAARLPLLGVG